MLKFFFYFDLLLEPPILTFGTSILTFGTANTYFWNLNTYFWNRQYLLLEPKYLLLEPQYLLFIPNKFSKCLVCYTYLKIGEIPTLKNTGGGSKKKF